MLRAPGALKLGRGAWKRYLDKPLNGLGRMGDVDPESAEQHKPECQLDRCDSGESEGALPRPYCPTMFSVGGHVCARSGLGPHVSDSIGSGAAP